MPLHRRLCPVDLCKATKMEEVGLWILNTVRGSQILQQQFEMALVETWIKECSQGIVVIYGGHCFRKP